MDKHSFLRAETMHLYHGSLGLAGGKISIYSGKGVGWNAMTLGDAFYTSVSSEAAQLFSHLVLQKERLKGGVILDNLGFSKVYKISLDSNFSILDADQPLDASSVRSVLLRAGVSARYLAFRHDDQLTDFNKSSDLLCYGSDWTGNRNEYLTKALGYDGLLIKERAWTSFEYYPPGIGIDWISLHKSDSWPPKTLAIYNVGKVSHFSLFKDGYQYQSVYEASVEGFGR